MFSDPVKILSQLPIQPGMVIADLGAGTGAYTFPAAKITGPTGKVYACEVQKDILVRLENDAKSQGITNIQTVHSNIETALGTKLRDQSVDWVIVANTLFQVEDQPALIQEIARILKPSGAVLLVDWTDSFGNLGPHAKDIITAQNAEDLFGAAGLKNAGIALDAGEHHYGIVFRKIV